MENEQDKTSTIKPSRDEKGRLLPGNTANPAGRPKGISIKDRVRKFLEENPDRMDEFVEYFATKNRDLAWQMLEGRPNQGIGQADELEPLQGVVILPQKDDSSLGTPAETEISTD
jgi:hypothetical protein